MKVVVIEFFDSDGMLIEQHMFWTRKRREFFCDYENNIKNSFVSLLGAKYPHLRNLMKTYEIKVHFYDEKTLDII